MSNIKVSVIVPVYNAERHLGKCVESILNQTLKEFELIIINDGSTDSSYELCKKYAVKDERIVLLDQKNSGVSVARNRGLDIAKGEYIYFIDADDYIEKNTLEILYNRAIASNSDIVVFGYKTISENSVYVEKVSDCEYTIQEFLAHYGDFIISSSILGAIWNKIYKRETINDIRFIEGIKHHEDLFFVQDVLRKCKLVSMQGDLYYNYINNDGSASRRHIENLFEIFLESHKKSIQFLTEMNSYETNIKAQNTCFIKLTINAIIMIMKSDENRKAKLEKIRYIFNNGNVKQAIMISAPSGAKEKLLFLLIKHKMSRFIYLLCKLKMSK